MEKLTKQQIIETLLYYPMLFGHMLGFDLLTDLHNDWIVDMVTGKEDTTLQAHRGSYKTTCVSIALSILIFLYPHLKIIFIRKTDTDVIEIINQVKKILTSEPMQTISTIVYGKSIILTKDNSTEVNTNLSTSVSGTSQLIGIGIGGSLTGKHADRIFTDDIVNKKDRASRAERDATKLAYQELINVKNRGGRIYNTGTPWHKDDAFVLMPPAKTYNCYETGLIDAETLKHLKESMTRSLFTANYELRHISEDDIIFANPVTGADPSLVEQGAGHIDSAYGGEDFTAYTECKKRDGKFYVYGRLWQKHVDDVLEEILAIHNNFNGGVIYTENNGDKGYLAKEIKKRGNRASVYHEDMNKYIKITTHLKAEWKNVIFVAGTDEEYINMILDYNENAEHDDAPDSLASIIRILRRKKESNYKSLYMLK